MLQTIYQQKRRTPATVVATIIENLRMHNEKCVHSQALHF